MLHFRLRFDRSILKTIDEEEYVSGYTTRTTTRRNVTMVPSARPIPPRSRPRARVHTYTPPTPPP